MNWLSAHGRYFGTWRPSAIGACRLPARQVPAVASGSSGIADRPPSTFPSLKSSGFGWRRGCPEKQAICPGARPRHRLAKLLASLPLAKARDLRTLSRRVIVGPDASFTIRGGAGAPPPELLRIFEDAFSRGHGLAFQYVDRSGAETRRTIEPHGLLVQPPVWYILSRDVEKGEPRTFRMDRISHPRIVPTIVFQPDVDVLRAQVPQGREWRPLVGSV